MVKEDEVAQPILRRVK